MSTDPNPPWYVFSPDGRCDPAGIPDRLLHHPTIQERGLVPARPIVPGVVFATVANPDFVIKVLNTDREEHAIYKRLLSDMNRSNNHTVPFELTQTGHPLLIMPFLDRMRWIHEGRWSTPEAMDVILQFVEGVDYLHSLHIVHMDICQMNVLAGREHCTAPLHQDVVVDRLYIIDFDSSKQFALGPGVQPAILLPDTQTDKPNGLELLDPYSWDVYCVGRTIEEVMKRVQDQSEFRKTRPPWIATKCIQWLIGNERGCPGVCRCRPTARTALRVVKLLVRVVYVVEGCRWMTRTILRLWPSLAWVESRSVARRTS
ncbi:hypothetical protein C2E23DRAFT_778132 [Lenzites betulinus]|nr:hypothetical protein C2E23DRAFT_778132 [Lenzites betulinus]